MCINVYLLQEVRGSVVLKSTYYSFPAAALLWMLMWIWVQQQLGCLFTTPRKDNALVPLLMTYETNALRNIYVTGNGLLD